MRPHSRDTMRPRFANSFALKRRGRREDRVRAAPAVSCAKMHLAKTHTSIQVQRKHSGLPCAMVYGLYRALPGDRLVATVIGGALPANLMPAPGHQDHTTLPSALAALVSRSLRVHRSPHPTSVTIAKRPSHGARDAANKQVIWVRRKQKYFCKRGWTQHRVICPSGKIDLMISASAPSS